MFHNFLTDDKIYEEVEKFWCQIFEEILASMGKKKEDWIVPFYTTAFANGKRFMDGNPIFSAKATTSAKSIRIIQHELMAENEKLLVWFDTDEKNEMVISCELNNSILAKIKTEITRFIENK